MADGGWVVGEFEEETYRKEVEERCTYLINLYLPGLPCLWIKELRVGYAQREREREVCTT